MTKPSFLRRSTSMLVLLTILLNLSSVAQKTVPWLGTIKWVNGYEREVSGENINYFSAFPEDATMALLTRATDGRKSIEWESATVPAGIKGRYVYFSWVASHSTGTSGGERNFDLYLNDRPVLTVTTRPANVNPDWTMVAPDSTRIVFVQLKRDHVGDAHGVVYLRVPLSRLTTGKPVRFRLTGQAQNSGDWFMTFKYGFQEKIEIRPSGCLLMSGQQNLLVHALHFGAPEQVKVSVNDRFLKQLTLQDGANTFDIAVNDVQKPDSVRIRVASSHRVWTDRKLPLSPVKHRTIFVLPHSHVDIGYTDLQPHIEAKQVDNLVKGMEYAERTKDYPEDARFVWNLENTYPAWLYMQRRSEAEKQVFLDAVKNGQVTINGMFLNTLTGLCKPEELLRLFQYGKELERMTGVPVNSAMISDIPGYTWGTVTAMAQAGIRYFSVAPNYGDRIGTILQEAEEKPFYWVSPSGREKVLVWIPYKGYALSHGIQQLDDKFVAGYVKMLEERKFPYDISYMRWSGHGDNAVPEMEVSDFVKDWNVRYQWPHFIVSGTGKAFAAFEQRYGDRLPEYRGDWTGYWEDGAGSSAFETAQGRNSSSRLSSAEAVWSINAPASMPADLLREAWRHVQLFSEHTWGADESVSRPLSEKTMGQWRIKKGYAAMADSLSRSLLAAGLAITGSGATDSVIEVINPHSWVRSDLVLVPAELSRIGDQVRAGDGSVVPSQRLSSGELAFVVKDLPAYSKRTYVIARGNMEPAGKQIPSSATLDNGLISVRIDERNGDIGSLRLSGDAQEFVEGSKGGGLNAYVFLEGSDPAGAKFSGPVTINVKDDGPVLRTVTVRSDAPGCRSLVRESRLVKGLDHLGITNILDKLPAPLNPNPGDYQWANTGGKESVHFSYPFRVPDGEFRLAVPFGVFRPDKDQIPGSCKNWLEVSEYADVSNMDHGVTWVPLDAPLVEIGEMSANLLGGQSDPAVWRKRIGTTQHLYSWALNNHWETNYCASQEGMITLRYAIRPHRAYDAVRALRFAMEQAQPLLVAKASSKKDTGPLLQLSSDDIIVASLRPSLDGQAYLVTLYNPTDKPAATMLVWGVPVAETRFSDTSEKPGALAGKSIEVGARSLRVVRCKL